MGNRGGRATIIKAHEPYGEPAVAMCADCDTKFDLSGDSMGEVECPHCGAVYNIFGQRLTGFTKPFVGENEYGERYYEDY